MFSKEDTIKFITEILQKVANLGVDALTYLKNFDKDTIENIQKIINHAVMPVASVLLVLFATLQIYKMISYLNDINAPQGGSARVESVGFTLIKIGFVYWVIQKMGSFMWGFVEAGTYLANKIKDVGDITGQTNIASVQDRIADLYEQAGSWAGLASFGTWINLWVVNLILWICSIVIMVILLGRMLQIYIMIGLSPLSLVTLIHDEQKQIGISFLKSFVAVILQGAVILFCIYLYQNVITAALVNTDNLMSMVWTSAGLGILMIVSIATSGAMAKKLTNAM